MSKQAAQPHTGYSATEFCHHKGGLNSHKSSLMYNRCLTHEVKTDMAQHTHKASEHHLTLDQRLNVCNPNGVSFSLSISAKVQMSQGKRKKSFKIQKKELCVCFIANL